MSDARWRLVVDQRGVTIAGDQFQLTAAAGPEGVPADPTVDDVLLGVAGSAHVESILHELTALSRRSYGQYCGLVRAQEILGERWATLILRDLTVSPKSTVALRAGLPRLPVEVLTARLDELESRGVIRRDRRPDGTDLCQLTEFGMELEDILLRMSRWGGRLLGEPRRDEIVTTDSLVVAIRATFRPEASRGVRAGYEIRIDDIVFHLRVDDGTLRAKRGPLAGADLVIEPGMSLRGLMSGEIDPIEAIDDGRVRVVGDPALLQRFTAMFRIPEPVSASGRVKRIRVHRPRVHRHPRRAAGSRDTDDAALPAVERAVETMRANLGERLTIDDLARSAMFSKFHFTRVFHRITGVSPGRFLSAIRLDEAKRLLESTALTVAEISHRVGYSSVGTFSSRFRGSVGVSPTGYRRFGGSVTLMSTSDGTATVRGAVGSESGPLGAVFVGLFAGRVLEAPAVGYTILREPGPYVLSDVPAGTWYLLACSVDSPRHIACQGPLRIERDITGRIADLRLRPMRAVDPPVLLALRDVRRATALAS